MALNATVVVEIFSGRPDPSWALDEHRTAELLRRLKTLPAVDDAALPSDPGLGYRGLHVATDDGAHRAIVEIRRGRAAYRGRILEDRARSLERWLLGTAPADLKELVHSVEKTL